jgi:hypothetical protein
LYGLFFSDTIEKYSQIAFSRSPIVLLKKYKQKKKDKNEKFFRSIRFDKNRELEMEALARDIILMHSMGYYQVKFFYGLPGVGKTFFSQEVLTSISDCYVVNIAELVMFPDPLPMFVRMMEKAKKNHIPIILDDADIIALDRRITDYRKSKDKEVERVESIVSALRNTVIAFLGSRSARGTTIIICSNMGSNIDQKDFVEERSSNRKVTQMDVSFPRRCNLSVFFPLPSEEELVEVYRFYTKFDQDQLEVLAAESYKKKLSHRDVRNITRVATSFSDAMKQIVHVGAMNYEYALRMIDDQVVTWRELEKLEKLEKNESKN